MEELNCLYINGQWVEGEGQKRKIINPANEKVLAELVEASESQVEQAIACAKSAFDSMDWSVNLNKRVQVLLRVAELIEEHGEALAKLETENTGKPIREARLDIEDSVTCLRYYADLVQSESFVEVKMDDETVSKVLYEPFGVCALIVPWNFPLLLSIWKIAPALAAGNTIIFKPSELTPLTMMRFAQLLREAGIPDGVFNLVLGDGKHVGQSMITSPLVEKVSFTGGVETGRHINEVCAKSFKKVSLELGGKSPLIVMEDAEVDKVVEWILFGGFYNQGEVCVASSRILIHKRIYQIVIDELQEKVQTIKIGNPLDEATEMGPIISKEHLEKVKAYIKLGVEEGATLLTHHEDYELGYYQRPTIFTDVKQGMSIVQEEIFGPVITVQSFQSEEEAVSLANGTKFGLAAGILSKDTAKASELASKLQAGIIWINNYHIPYVEAPWGGYKQSGNGRELGPQGLDSYRQAKHVNSSEQLPVLDWYSLNMIKEEK